MTNWTKLLAVIVLSAIVGVAFAQYNSEYDKEVRIGGFLGNFVADTLPVEETGSLMFEAQEGGHQTLYDSTGAEVEHYYIWVCFGDDEDSCVPADPYRFSD